MTSTGKGNNNTAVLYKMGKLSAAHRSTGNLQLNKGQFITLQEAARRTRIEAHALDFSLLPALINKLKLNDPQGHYAIQLKRAPFTMKGPKTGEVTPYGVHRLFMMESTAKEFFAKSRGIAVIDASHMKQHFGGILLLLTCKAADNSIIPVAKAIVFEAETKDGWCWMISTFLNAIGKETKVRLMLADGHNGFSMMRDYFNRRAAHVQAEKLWEKNQKEIVEDEVAVHTREMVFGSCALHMYKSITTRHSPEFLNQVRNIALASTEEEARKRLAALQYAKYKAPGLSDEAMAKVALAMDNFCFYRYRELGLDCPYGEMFSNAVENENSAFSKVRASAMVDAVIGCLDITRHSFESLQPKLQRYDDRKEEVTMGDKAFKSVAKFADKAKNRGLQYRVLKVDVEDGDMAGDKKGPLKSISIAMSLTAQANYETKTYTTTVDGKKWQYSTLPRRTYWQVNLVWDETLPFEKKVDCSCGDHLALGMPCEHICHVLYFLHAILKEGAGLSLTREQMQRFMLNQKMWYSVEYHVDTLRKQVHLHASHVCVPKRSELHHTQTVPLLFERFAGVIGKRTNRKKRSLQSTALTLSRDDEQGRTRSTSGSTKSRSSGKDSAKRWPCSHCRNEFSERDTEFMMCDGYDLGCPCMVCDGKGCRAYLNEHEATCKLGRRAGGVDDSLDDEDADEDEDEDDDSHADKCNSSKEGAYVPISMGNDANVEAMARLDPETTRRIQSAANQVCTACGKPGHSAPKCENPDVGYFMTHDSNNRRAMANTILGAPVICPAAAKALEDPDHLHIPDLADLPAETQAVGLGLREGREAAEAAANIRHAAQQSNPVIQSALAAWGFRNLTPIALNNTHTGLPVEEVLKRQFIRENSRTRLGRMSSDVQQGLRNSQQTLFNQLSQPSANP